MRRPPPSGTRTLDAEGAAHGPFPVSRCYGDSDAAAPGAGLDAALLDQLLEAVEVLADAAAVRADRGADLLLHALGLPLHPDGDLGAGILDRLGRDLARLLDATLALPGDAPVGLLGDDLGVPLVALAAVFGDPVQVRVVELPDRVDVLHELRKVLELRPLVVGGRDGDVDLDALLDSGHRAPFESWTIPGRLPDRPEVKTLRRRPWRCARRGARDRPARPPARACWHSAGRRRGGARRARARSRGTPRSTSRTRSPVPRWRRSSRRRRAHPPGCRARA